MDQKRALTAALLAAISVLLLTLVFILFPAKPAVPPEYSSLYLDGKRSLFLSLRDFRTMSAAADELRKTALPGVGSVNRFLYIVEYALDHRMSVQDLNDVLGNDFTLQLRPYPLLIARTRREYNFFYYVKTGNDRAVPYRGFTIRVKELGPATPRLYYAFTDTYLFVTDNLRNLKRALMMHPVNFLLKTSSPRSFRYLLYDSMPGDALDLLSLYKPLRIHGNSLSSLVSQGRRSDDASVFDPEAAAFCNLDLGKALRTGHSVPGKVLIRAVSVVRGKAFLDCALILPARLSVRTRAKLYAAAAKQFGLNEAPLTETEAGPYRILSTLGWSPALERTDLIFKLDLTRFRDTLMKDPAAQLFLQTAGSIEVRIPAGTKNKTGTGTGDRP
jgi:hypothetical protein